MLKITNLVTPSPEQFDVVIKGMRLPMKSGDKSDSFLCDGEYNDDCNKCRHFLGTDTNDSVYCDLWNGGLDKFSGFIIGDKDKQLLLNLCKAGDPSHRKLLRQLPVKCFITAPLYWWKQMDQYKVSTVTNSESTMHCMVKEPFKVEDFSIEHINLIPKEYEWGEIIAETHLNTTIELLNQLRKKYLENKDMNYWYAINEFLPQSYNQTRCWSGNYETLVNIINQRKNHKLIEWSQFSDYMLENVPYLKEIVEAINGTSA